MTLDDLIRISLKLAAEETEMTDEKKVELLLRILTAFLSKSIQ